MGIFRGSGYIVMTAGAKKDQLQLTVPILTFLNRVSRRLRGNSHFGTLVIGGHLGFLNLIPPTLRTHTHTWENTHGRYKQGPNSELRRKFSTQTHLLCQDQIIVLCGCRYQVTFWWMMRGKETEQLTGEKKTESDSI